MTLAVSVHLMKVFQLLTWQCVTSLCILRLIAILYYACDSCSIIVIYVVSIVVILLIGSLAKCNIV